MDLLTLALGFGVVGAAALVDVRGMDWAQRRYSEKLNKEACSRPLIREFPSSQHEILLSDSEVNSVKIT